MGTSHKFTILEKKQDSVTVKIEVIHPDYPYLPRQLDAGLQFLVDAYSNIKKGYIYNASFQYYPINREEAKALIKDNASKMDVLLDIYLPPEQKISKETYLKFKNSSEIPYIEGRRVASYGTNNEGEHHLHLETDYDLFCQKADELIESVECISVKNYPHWDKRLNIWIDHFGFMQRPYPIPEHVHQAHEKDPNPQYTLAIKVKEGQEYLLDHIIEDSYWESGLLDFQYYAKNYQSSHQAKKFLLEPAILEENYTDEQIGAWWENLAETWKNNLSINFDLQSRLLFDRLVIRLINTHITATWKEITKKQEITPLDKEEQLMLPKLKGLFATYARLTTLEPLSMLKGIELLDITGNPIKDIQPLLHLKSLQFLCISECSSIKDFTPLAKLTQLKHILFETWGDFSFDLFADLKQLRMINFYATNTTGYTTLLDLPSLEKITGHTSKLSEEDQKVIEKLREKGVTVEIELGE